MPDDKALETVGIQKIIYSSEFDSMRNKVSLLDLKEFGSKSKELKNVSLSMAYENSKRTNRSKVSPVSKKYVEDESKADNLNEINEMFRRMSSEVIPLNDQTSVHKDKGASLKRLGSNKEA